MNTTVKFSLFVGVSFRSKEEQRRGLVKDWTGHGDSTVDASDPDLDVWKGIGSHFIKRNQEFIKIYLINNDLFLQTNDSIGVYSLAP